MIQVQTRKQVKAFIDVHSYSQLWIYTWAEKTEDIPNKAAQDLIGRLATDAIKDTYGMTYEYGQTGQLLYVATGTTIDYAYDKLDIPCSLTVELRDTGRYGFLLPADQIVPTAEETYNAYKVMAFGIIEGLCDSK